MVCSEAISLSFENFREIVVGLSSAVTTEHSQDQRYSFAFWKLSNFVIFINKGFPEENRIQLIKDIIIFKHYIHIYIILDYNCCSNDNNTSNDNNDNNENDSCIIISDKFDLVDFCYKNSVDPFIIEHCIKPNYLKTSTYFLTYKNRFYIITVLLLLLMYCGIIFTSKN